MGERRDLVGLVPGEDAEVVIPQGIAAPLVVRGHHQISGQIVAALLTSAIVTMKMSLSQLLLKLEKKSTLTLECQ